MLLNLWCFFWVKIDVQYVAEFMTFSKKMFFFLVEGCSIYYCIYDGFCRNNI